MVMMTIYDDDDDEVSAYLLVRDDRVAQGAIGHPPERKIHLREKKIQLNPTILKLIHQYHYFHY